MIAHTTALEEQITTGAKYADCFKGTDLRRTEIVCMVWAIQNLSVNSFSGYATYVSTLLSLLGGMRQALKVSIVLVCVNAVHVASKVVL